MVRIKVIGVKKAIIKKEGPNDANNQGILNRHSYAPTIVKIDPKDCDRFICIWCTPNEAKKEAGEGNEEEEEKVGVKLSWFHKHLATNSHRSFTPRDQKPSFEAALNRPFKQSKKIIRCDNFAEKEW